MDNELVCLCVCESKGGRVKACNISTPSSRVYICLAAVVKERLHPSRDARRTHSVIDESLIDSLCGWEPMNVASYPNIFACDCKSLIQRLRAFFHVSLTHEPSITRPTLLSSLF